MMKKLKRVAMVALAIVLAVSALAGCSKTKRADTSKQVTLKWVINMAKQADADKVQDAFNEQLSKLLPNTKVEFVWEPSVDAKWSLWMASKTSYDIVWRGSYTDMSAEYDAGTYMPLNDLIEDYAPNLQAEREKWTTAYSTGEFDGELYAIPNEQPILHQSSWIRVMSDWADYFPTDEFLAEAHANATTTEKMYQLVDSYFDTLAEKKLITPGECSIDIVNFFKAFACRGYDFVGANKNGAWLCYPAFDKDAKITTFFETEEYKLYIKYAAKWFEKGYISEDYMATGTISGTLLTDGNTNGCWYGIEDEKGVKSSYDADGKLTSYQLFMDSMEQQYLGANNFGAEKTYNVIPFTSKNPERAIMLLDLLASEEGADLMNLVIYGIEGEHYTKEVVSEDDVVAHGVGYVEQANSSNLYGVPHWMVTNVFNCYRTPNIMEGQKEWAEKIVTQTDDTYHTKYYGARFDLLDISYEIQQVSLVVSEYHEQLLCGGLGSKGYEALYKTFVDKMYDVGLDKVMKSVNEQSKDLAK